LTDCFCDSRTSHGLDCLEVYLQLATGAPARYDAISFNFGLHDLGNRPSDISTYAAQLAAIADRLVKTKAKLLYLMTTPMMPECCAGAALLPSGEGAPVPKCSAGAAATYRCDSVVSLQALSSCFKRKSYRVDPKFGQTYKFWANLVTFALMTL
jgi:hypothetical protein